MCGGRGAENGVIPHACRFRVYSHPIQCIHSFTRAPNRLLAAFPTPPICLLMGWLVCTSVPELMLSWASWLRRAIPISQASRHAKPDRYSRIQGEVRGRGAATWRALSESRGDETCRTALLPLSGLAAAVRATARRDADARATASPARIRLHGGHSHCAVLRSTFR